MCVQSIEWLHGTTSEWGDCTPGLWTAMTPGLLSSLDWTPGLLISMPPGLTPSLLLAGRLRGAPGRGALDADCCISEQARFLMGVFRVTS